MGSIELAWAKVIASLESEEENHRVLSATLSQDGSKVMKAFTEQQVKTREPVSLTLFVSGNQMFSVSLYLYLNCIGLHY